MEKKIPHILLCVITNAYTFTRIRPVKKFEISHKTPPQQAVLLFTKVLFPLLQTNYEKAMYQLKVLFEAIV